MDSKFCVDPYENSCFYCFVYMKFNLILNMSNAKKCLWSQEAVSKLIDMWKKKEVLYNPRDPFYHNIQSHYQALNEITDELKGILPKIMVSDVKNKMTYLRGQYTKECTKEKAILADSFHSNCWWYEEMAFMKEFVQVRQSKCNLSINSDESMTNESTNESTPIKKVATKRDSSSLEDDLLMIASKLLKTVQEKPKSRAIGICKFLEVELETIKDENILDEVIENITTAVFDGKRKQRMMMEHTNVEHRFYP